MMPTSKEEFMVILERQQNSGLSIKDFCVNESYAASSFYYWKSKFGFARPYNNHERKTSMEQLAPISFNLSGGIPLVQEACSNNNLGEIRMSFPGDIQVSFIGNNQMQAAINLLAQLLSAHVLPK